MLKCYWKKKPGITIKRPPLRTIKIIDLISKTVLENPLDIARISESLKSRPSTEKSKSTAASDESYEYSDSDTSVISDTEEFFTFVKSQIKSCGLYEWLNEFCLNKKEDVGTLVTRLTKFICWFIQKYPADLSSDFSDDLFYSSLHKFLLLHTECLSEYCKHLTESLLKASTVRNTIENILSSCRWFATFRPGCKSSFVVSSGILILSLYS